MSRLDQAQEVIDLAERLGLQGDPVDGIIGYCHDRIDSWVDEVSGVISVDQLESVVARNLNLTFEELLDDDDLDQVVDRYVARGETVFAALPVKLTADTFGTLIRLSDGSYAAVIDGRDDKASRRFFTKWHEIAHLLVANEEFDEQVFRENHDPLEKLMDQIAGRVGFYDPLFAPLLRQQVPERQLLSLGSVESIRQEYCSYASFQSTLFACQSRLTTPLVYVEAEMRHKAAQRRLLNSGQQFLLDDMQPEAKLRVSLVISNDAATDQDFTIPQNMRVAESSPIYRAYEGNTLDSSGYENMRDWSFSDGNHLPACEVFTEARRIEDIVIALVQPIPKNIAIGR